MNRLVEIVPLEAADRSLLSSLAVEIPRVFPVTCRVGPAERLPDAALDGQRAQYDAGCILDRLAASGRDAFRLVGITPVDLFTPVLRYVFGEAMFPGQAAVVSTYRLGASLSGGQGPGDRSVFVARVLKEVIHEIGHTFGLTHCRDRLCVMAASLDMKQVDAKSTRLCSYCNVLLGDMLNS